MKYPKGIKINKTQTIYSNRGMTLENDLNESNSYYLNNDIAIVYKKPTPITIVDVDYHSRKNATITKAYFMTPSTTDYNGIYKGKYIDFEAKETTNHSSFPLNNIHSHQIDHLNKVFLHGGIAFIIIRFTKINETYLLTYEKLNEFLRLNKRKSIPISFIRDNGYRIFDKINPIVDYLIIIDQIYFKGDVL